MLNKTDLHCHTLYSDGSLSPQQIVERAAQNGVSSLAITDHDCIQAVLDLWPNRDKLPLTLISGVEISSSWEGKDIHVIGLNFEPYDQSLQDFLKQQQQLRFERAQELMQKLTDKLGILDIEQKLQKISQGYSICRSHFAALIVEEGKTSDFGKAFSKFLAKGKSCSVKSHWVSTEEAISHIHQAGGVAVLAHPSRYQLSNSRTFELIKSFSFAGGKAIEVCYSSLKSQDQRRLIRIAKEFSLLGSVGSDFHHPYQTWANLGQVAPLPADILPIWQNF